MIPILHTRNSSHRRDPPCVEASKSLPCDQERCSHNSSGQRQTLISMFPASGRLHRDASANRAKPIRNPWTMSFASETIGRSKQAQMGMGLPVFYPYGDLSA